MNLQEIILNCNSFEEKEGITLFVYAKKINGKFDPNSDAIVLELTESDMEMDVDDIANFKCPNFEYFLEIFIIQDLHNDLINHEDFKLDQQKVERIIYYAEYDA